MQPGGMPVPSTDGIGLHMKLGLLLGKMKQLKVTFLKATGAQLEMHISWLDAEAHRPV